MAIAVPRGFYDTFYDILAPIGFKYGKIHLLQNSKQQKTNPKLPKIQAKNCHWNIEIIN